MAYHNTVVGPNCRLERISYQHTAVCKHYPLCFKFRL